MTSLIVISEKYWPYGGAELATHLIVRALRDEGFNITVATGIKNFRCLKGVRYIYLPLLNARTKIHLWKNMLLVRESLTKLIRKHNVLYIPKLAYPVIPIAKKFGKKVIVHLHDYQPISYEADYYPSEGDHDPTMLHEFSKTMKVELFNHESSVRALIASFLTPINYLNRLWIPKADEIICVSARQSEIIKRAMPELAGKIRVIYNLPPAVPYAPKRTNEPAFLYIGGDSYYKGFHIFLKATSLISKKNSVHFFLTRNYKNKSRILINFLNKRFDNAYNMLGWLSQERLLVLHSMVCGLIFPSIWEEPLPYGVIESMLAGTIPIASRVGGIPEIVQGTYTERMLFTPGDADELADKMEEVLSLSKEQLINIGVSLREAALRRFDADAIRVQLLNVFTLK
jgi:glycosyltransferase involved in cell wall biosynthesis